ncbi:DNA double-strand break repair nuclease NurA [Saccharolobus solfataricus]|uniref:DNA double-strand break repair nuclease NurA n=1 Tax=Saccharolobus solfataricus TaxID=2287 RepID=A0A7S9IKD7_SACSO|nr:DNA double-strand break repair nuclease NurA [Saccharolobus solfataricus]QPG50765.1 DNA double-strand break repair nuclease NurA [Saccharolobus solfataricus]
MNMSSNIDSGDFSTIVRLRSNKNYFLNRELTFAAIDGSFSDVILEGEKGAYIVIGIIKGKIFKDFKFTIDGISVKDELCICEAEKRMRELEYSSLKENEVDLIFFDRKLSFDKSLGILVPKNSIGIVKDFDIVKRERLNKVENPPWLVIEEDNGDTISGYFKLFPSSWVFYIESQVLVNDYEELLYLIYNLGMEPIPEALGYNYPLFLADKLVKYYRNKLSKFINTASLQSNIRYREFRSWIERLRNDGKYF